MSEKSFHDNASHNGDAFKELVFVKTLSEDHDRKKIAFETNFNETRGVVLLELKPLTRELAEQVFNEPHIPSVVMRNDIYGVYNMNVKEAGLLATIVHPATDKHIAKFSESQMVLVHETPKQFAEITKPVIEEACLGLTWIENILTHQSEAHDIIFEDDDKSSGFILVPDYMWDRKDVKQMHLLAICHRRDITCLRDLTLVHIPLLENILQKGTEAILDKYGIPANELRVFIHYQPSFYHFHVHFTSLSSGYIGSPLAERSHLVANVIDNIRLMADYYQRASLTYAVKKGTRLYEAWFDNK